MKKLGHLVGCAATVAFVLSCQQPESDVAPGREMDPGATPAAVGVDTRNSPDSLLRSTGWTNLKIGMSRAEVVAAAGEDAHPEAVGGPDPSLCDEFRPVRAPDGLLVMIHQDTLTRIAITGRTGIATERGISVGDSASAVRRTYGDGLVASPHPFHSPPAEYLTAWDVKPPGPTARGIVYEIARSGLVLRILAGDESIEYPEGCV